MSRDDLLRHSLNALRLTLKVALGYAREHPWTVAVALYGLARACGVTVRSGQRGVLFRWGSVVKELEPGFYWLVPFLQAVRKTPVRSVTLDLAGQRVMTADGLPYDASVNVVYRVEDATKAVTRIDHVEAGCRAVIPLVVTELLRVRDQAQLANRATLDRELAERVNARVARWGLVVEQAGFTTLAPNRRALGTTQLQARTEERAGALRTLIGGGLDAEAALVLLGTERRPAARSGRRYRTTSRPLGSARRKKEAPDAPSAPKPGGAVAPAKPVAPAQNSAAPKPAKA